MLDYASLAAVATIVREGVSSAPHARSTSHPSAISQRIKQLEERLGCVLIVRGQPCADDRDRPSALPARGTSRNVGAGFAHRAAPRGALGVGRRTCNACEWPSTPTVSVPGSSAP